MPAEQELGRIARAGREGAGPELDPRIWRALEIALVRGTTSHRVRAAYAFGELRILPRRLMTLIEETFREEALAGGDAELSTALMHTIGEYKAAEANGEYCLPTLTGQVAQ